MKDTKVERLVSKKITNFLFLHKVGTELRAFHTRVGCLLTAFIGIKNVAFKHIYHSFLGVFFMKL